MQPLPINYAPGGFESQSIQGLQPTRLIPRVETRVRPRVRRFVRPEPPSSWMIIYVTDCTESVVFYSSSGAAGVSGQVNLRIEQPARSQILLQRDFARLVSFDLEPEQPTDADVRHGPVYKFPG